jgi:ABC-type multidrug transport system ATPase subunit
METENEDDVEVQWKDDVDARSSDSSGEESISKQAKKEFDRPEYKEVTEIFCRPIIVRDFAIKKDAAGKLSTSSDGGGAPPPKMAPNFASAVVGEWIATKIGLGGKTPTAVDQDDTMTSDHNEYVVNDVNILLIPGEGTLLLGPSSSGKTTLMRTLYDVITGKISSAGKEKLEGTVHVGATDMIHSTPEMNLSRTAAFVDQSDLTLAPILTVEETVRFSRACAEGDLHFMDESLEAIFKLAGLDHVTGTVVGDSDIRGVSGGQKRRVKFLEMAVGMNITTFFLDEITNGLDSASAFSVCKVIREAFETIKEMGLICLLQPSNDVFNTFHRLILLSAHGRIVYSGKTEGAVPHFESLGLVRPEGMNIPEFLLKCASSPTEFWDQESKGTIPQNISTPANIAELFLNTDAGRSLINEMDQVATEEEENAETIKIKQQEWGRIPDFAQPFHRQIALLVGRGFKLVKRNPTTIMRVATSIILGREFSSFLFLSDP